MTEDRFGELLGPYVLGELTADEERELERHLGGCPGCRRELDLIRQTHNRLRQLAADEPPPELKEWVMASVTGGDSARSRSRRRLWVLAAAALLVVAISGVGLLRTISDVPSDGVPLTATALAPGAGGEVRGEKVGENIQVELEVWGLPELRKDEYYEMWYAREGSGRITCGTFRMGSEGRMTVNLTAPVNAGAYPEIEVTREPDDGNPETSGEEVLEGDLRDL